MNNAVSLYFHHRIETSLVFLKFAMQHISQELNLRNTYRILNIQFSINQLPSYMVYNVIDIFRCLAVKVIGKSL